MSIESAKEWLAQDPDPDTRAELEKLVAAGGAELAERFAGTLEFGTAGIRGILGAGPMRMNRVLVMKVSSGLAEYVCAKVQGAAERGIVIGYDGRRNSRVFAEDTARVFLGAGFKVYLADHVVPTPVTAFAVGDLGAAVGVMVTASHNPPDYNGYKVYWENAAQIIPPHDAGISEHIDRVKRVDRLALGDLDEARAKGRLVSLGEQVLGRYYQGVLALQLHPEALRDVDLSVAYTPMHGVGGRFVRELFARAGVGRLFVEDSQAEPDGDFPTVAFPNPEEDGAMDRVFALATKHHVDLVIANDPDADRLAIAIPSNSGYQMLTGDQIGVLLADYLLREGSQDGRRMVATTLVSSQLLGIMAESMGVDFELTLTGFKWIANTALSHRAKTGARFVMGYEEALGYSVGELVRDKDGVSAALLFAELAAFCKVSGESVADRLESIYRRHGVFLTKQKSLVLPGADGQARIAAHMARFRGASFREMAGFAVVESRDLAKVEDGTPPSDVLIYRLEGNRRIILRPSGTEPKLKCYYEVCEPVVDGEPVSAALARAKEQVEALCARHQAMMA